MKATSIVYAPLIWVVRRSFDSRLSVKKQLKFIRKDDISRISLAYSVVVTAFSIIKLHFLVSIQEFWVSGNPLIDSLIDPFKFPLWQIASIFNALLTISIFIFAGRLLRQKTYNKTLLGGTATEALGLLSTARAVLSVYWILPSVIYIVFNEVIVNIPRVIDKEFFPWS